MHCIFIMWLGFCWNVNMRTPLPVTRHWSWTDFFRYWSHSYQRYRYASCIVKDNFLSVWSIGVGIYLVLKKLYTKMKKTAMFLWDNNLVYIPIKNESGQWRWLFGPQSSFWRNSRYTYCLPDHQLYPTFILLLFLLLSKVWKLCVPVCQ